MKDPLLEAMVGRPRVMDKGQRRGAPMTANRGLIGRENAELSRRLYEQELARSMSDPEYRKRATEQMMQEDPDAANLGPEVLEWMMGSVMPQEGAIKGVDWDAELERAFANRDKLRRGNTSAKDYYTPHKAPWKAGSWKNFMDRG